MTRVKANDIFIYLKSWLPFFEHLQKDKNKYSLEELNKKYFEYGKKYLTKREQIRAIILEDKVLYDEVKQLCSESFLFDTLLEGYSNDINRSTTDAEDAILPILPFPEQLKLMHVLQFGKKHVHIQKSRRQGASVFTSLYMAWLLKHGKNLTFFATHKDLAALDGGAADIGYNSTFGRITWYFDKSMFIANDWKDKKQFWNGVTEQYLRAEKTIIANNNSLTGAVLGKSTSVGFAGHMILIDELDVVCDLFPNHADSIFGSFSTAVNRMIIFSTYRGMDYPFYRIWEQHDTKEWDFVTLDWKDNPVCNTDWYNQQRSKMNQDEVLIARELDINPAKTREGVIWQTIDNDNLKSLYKKSFPATQYNKVVGADFGGGSSATAFIFAYQHKGTGKLYLYDLIKTTSMDEYQIADAFKEKGFFGVPVAGDMSGAYQAGSPQHDWNNVLKKVGIKVLPIYNKDPHLVRATIRIAFQNNQIYINKDNLQLRRDLMSASYRKESDKIDKGVASHTADALLYLYRYLFSQDSGVQRVDY